MIHNLGGHIVLHTSIALCRMLVYLNTHVLLDAAEQVK